MIDEEIEEIQQIDQSVWLPKGMPLITAERRAKGDMRTEGEDGERSPQNLSDIRFAQALVRNIMAYLWNSGAIDDQHYHDGKTFQIWHEVFSSQFGIKKNSIYNSELKGELKKEGLNEYGFILLLQRIHRKDIAMIHHAVDTIQSEHTVFLASKNRMAYRRAFDRLTTVIPQIRDELESIAKARESADENLDDMFFRLQLKLGQKKNV